MPHINPGDQLAVTAPGDLKQAADDLREHARRLYQLMSSLEGVLQPVDVLDNPNTWAGPFADNFGTIKSGWKHGLQSAFYAIRTMMQSLDADAAELEARASKPGSGAGGH